MSVPRETRTDRIYTSKGREGGGAAASATVCKMDTGEEEEEEEDVRGKVSLHSLPPGIEVPARTLGLHGGEIDQ